MGKRLWIFGLFLLAGALAALAGSLVLGQECASRPLAQRLLFLGRPLLEFRAPKAGQLVPLGSIEVIVGFPSEDRVVLETFRCLLNDEDVTEHLTLGHNGAGGSVYGLVEGENHLRVEVFGHGWWPGWFLEDSREVIFRVQPLPTIDQARAATPSPLLDTAERGLSLPRTRGARVSA
jgi:hypothetical protein